ncbi:MAG: DUF3108 domain-containing protein [Granulosicoccus sp.]
MLQYQNSNSFMHRMVAWKPVGQWLLFFACHLIAPISVQAQTIPEQGIAPFEVVYEVGNNLISAGSAKLSLNKEGDDWVYRLSTKPTGIFKLTGKGRVQEVSVIDIVQSGDSVQLHPKKYTYRQDKEKRRSVDAFFDWSNNQLTWTKRGETVTETFSAPVLDRLSVTLAVMNALRSEFEEKQMQVFDNGRVKTMQFINEGKEILDTKLGEIETIRVRSSQAKKNSSRYSLTWFAPALDYVPIKIEQHKRDKLVARLSLQRLVNRVTDIELEDEAMDDVAPPPDAGLGD